MFYFREQELNQLEAFAASPSDRAMAVYGRRRAGKTEMVLHFMENHPDTKILYVQCSSFDYRVCLADFVHGLQHFRPDDTILNSLTSFKDVFQYILPSPGIDIIIIDEFPFLCKKRESAPAEFQWIIDHALQHEKLILLGSNRSFMRSQIGDAQSPLYGRFDEILEVLPFTFQEVHTLFPTFEDAVAVYGMTGGVAQYVVFLLRYPTVKEGIEKLFLNRNGRLFQEASGYLMQELKDITVYASILRAIGGSDTESGRIAKKCAMDQKSIFAYLHRLEELEIVRTITNPLMEKKRGARYRISDRLLRFHYTFIEPNISMITALGAKAAPYILGDHLQEYLGFVYEEIIQENCFTYALQKKIPFMPEVIGKWWGNVMNDGKWSESEIDLVAFNSQSIVVGECKYRQKKMGLNELILLEKKASFMPVKGRKLYYLLASRNGFTDELLARKDVILIEQA